MDRIEKLCEHLDKCESFADVGCDHGYCTLYMLKNGLCEKAVISDISAKCLQKAERLLRGYISCGKVLPVCCDGLEKIDENTSQILIAGMGGEEIVNILKTAYIPRSFVFQPMKNERKLREFLVQNGAEITLDKPLVIGGKFYYVIKGKRQGKSSYSEAQYEYGKDLKSAETKAYMGVELKKMQGYLTREMSEQHRLELEKRVRFTEDILSGKVE